MHKRIGSVIDNLGILIISYYVASVIFYSVATIV